MSFHVSAIIFQLFIVIMLEKCALTILELNWNQSLGRDLIEHLSSYAHVIHTTAKKVSRHRKNENVFKMSKVKNARAKILFFIVKYANLWGFCCRRRRGCFKLSSLAPREELIVFAYQIWKPQFLSVL